MLKKCKFFLSRMLRQCKSQEKINFLKNKISVLAIELSMKIKSIESKAAKIICFL